MTRLAHCALLAAIALAGCDAQHSSTATAHGPPEVEVPLTSAVTTAAELPTLIGRHVELLGVYGGLGKNGPYVLVDGEQVDLRADGPFEDLLENTGRPLVARGVLRHTGPMEPPSGNEIADPVAAAMETYFLEHASHEFVDGPLPTLAGQVGKWVVLRGTLEIGKAGLLVVTGSGPVYLEGDLDPALDGRQGAHAIAFGILEHAEGSPRSGEIEPETQVAQLPERYFLRDGRVTLIDPRRRDP